MIATVAIALILVYVLWDRRVERREWMKERQLLLTRIQTPELAPTLAPQDDIEPPVWISPEDDKAFQDALRERNGANGTD